MRKLFLIPALFLLATCAYKTIPLKGKYQTEPFTKTTTTPVDKVWDKLVDLFATKGLSIKVIDRSSGLIVSEKYRLTVTQEDSKGKIQDPNAYVVLPKVYNPGSRTILAPNYVLGEWNVRIKNDGNGGTVINVNLVNINNVYVDLKGFTNERPSTGFSTGVFEKLIFETIK